MKKNLRIVSAAAAALLAVAPVAATGLSQVASAATVSSTNLSSSLPTQSVASSATNSQLESSAANYVGNNTFEVTNDGVTYTIKVNPSVKLSGDFQSSTTNANGQKTASVNVNGTYGDNKSGIVYDVTASKAVNDGASFTFAGQTFSFKDFVNTNNNGTNVTSFQVIASNPVSVNYDVAAATPADKSSATIDSGSSNVIAADGNTTPVINAVGKTANTNGSVTGSLSVSLNNQNYTALLHYNGQNTNFTITDASGKTVSAANIQSGQSYTGTFNDVTVNLGNSYANKPVELTLTKGVFANPVSGAKLSNNNKTLTVTADGNGVAHLGSVVVPFTAINPYLSTGINFFDNKTGNVVTSGSVDLNAVNGQISVQQLFAAMTNKYTADQVNGSVVTPLNPINDLVDQLKKQNITVDAQGFFEAPQSFTVNLNAKSEDNKATASLPITVNVPNGKAVDNSANEVTTTKTIMHIAARYDKNGKKLALSTLRAYDEVSVVSTPVTINGAKYYKLAGKDEYVKASNIDGTSKKLKKNSYIYKRSATTNKFSKTKNYKSTKKLAGETVTVYGGKMYNGSWYRIGKNQYIRARNF